MNRTTAARVAGFTFLFYIVVGISSMDLTGITVSRPTLDGRCRLGHFSSAASLRNEADSWACRSRR